MSTSDVNVDIGNYVYWKTREQSRLRRLPSRVQKIIQEKLAAKADGSFRWVECQMDALVNNTRSQAAIEKALESMSSGLEIVYTKTLEGISPSDCSLVRNALLWLAFSSRPMTGEELGEAMIFNGSTESVNPAQKLFREETKDILRNCRILIKYNDEYKSSTLAHDSVREYLFSESCLKRASSYSLNVEVDACLLCCLMVDYLNMPVFRSGYCPSRVALRERSEEWPLLGYISTALPKLLESVSWEIPTIATDKMKRKLKALFGSAIQPRGGNFGAFIQASSPWTDLGGQIFSPLYFAASTGLAKAIKFLLTMGLADTLEQPGGHRQSTPLHVACTFGHTEVVRVLLEAKANPNEKNKYEERGIEWAYLHGYHKIVQMLLDHGAEAVSEDGLNRIREKVKAAQSMARTRIVLKRWELAAGIS
ncbi:uncharacterized protein K452DRAFT_286013 [Aplosporella prunicola CBS 121167]|uniref:Uncharacterized protein n=1 Tax=Aplosporella prunicola CBS 121167 TaxID=1176127 RepID=A0A6A6BKS1_9PEZI|nr:uncharacterized protein K452DRAFT_286013 [Aplosporella prunicola CBS 121167]KAF2143171.1 hypothetical protein K452DRAFT_286013 [Aplosporella prunicola CBS 121167]